MNIAVVLAGGSGRRMKMNGSKQLLPLENKPVFMHSVELFVQMGDINHIVVVYNPEFEKEFKILLKDNREVSLVKGGKERWESSKNALEFIKKKFKNCSYVLIHDGARPFLKPELVENILYNTIKFGAAIPVLPVKDTIKSVSNGFINKTLKRKELVRVQTPQGFIFRNLYEIYNKVDFSRLEITDDSSLFENSGFSVAAVEGLEENIKITTQYDLKLAKKNNGSDCASPGQEQK
ncbi:MAG: 2-C-methyl-D-erythritol 4-phosphate cytidylyltransferase [Candidatus Muiribacteriota bacterium]